MIDQGWGVFPFGAPLRPCGVEIPEGRRKVFVIGAYPSALHVRWIPPEPWKPVSALPVDNEPIPFWDGDEAVAQEFFDRWRVEYFNESWGSVTPSRLNGSSGDKLVERWLAPFGAAREDATIVDCLPLSRQSIGVAKRLADTYDAFATSMGAPKACLAKHPSETQIVQEAIDGQLDRLRAQLEAAQPELVITLGNAAARVLAALDGQPEKGGVLEQSSYGLPRPLTTVVGAEWQALIHPAAPKSWQATHDQWLEGHLSGPGSAVVRGAAPDS